MRQESQGELDYWALAYAHEQEYHARKMELLTWEAEQRVKMYGDILMKTTYPS